MRQKAGDPERQPERWGAFLSSGATIRSFRPEGVRTGTACALLGARAGAHGGRAAAVGLQVEGGVAGGRGCLLAVWPWTGDPSEPRELKG